eukprot:6084469-Pleurochrysis_carterae.AAC.5
MDSVISSEEDVTDIMIYESYVLTSFVYTYCSHQAPVQTTCRVNDLGKRPVSMPSAMPVKACAFARSLQASMAAPAGLPLRPCDWAPVAPEAERCEARALRR